MKHSCSIILAAVMAAAIPVAASAQSGAMPKLHTNQEYVEEVARQSDLAVDDPAAVLAFVLSSLQDRVKVYPTENYFYFNFHHGGIKWTGNLRLDVETRDEGRLHMTYYKDFTPWYRDEEHHSVVWGAEEGVEVTKVADLLYRVSFRGHSVLFELNDVGAVSPPATALRQGEIYIGPVFDESGLRLFLIFDPVNLVFLYVLDEQIRQPEEWIESRISERITIGRRTGFAFYKDHFLDRRILIGVYGGNTRLNNYLDGPFDQLPDNFLEGDTLRDAILKVSPHMEGEIDRFGNSQDDTVRYLIAPYMLYEDEYDLAQFDHCANSEKLPQYYTCFSLAGPSYEGEEDFSEDPPPEAPMPPAPESAPSPPPAD